MNFLYTKCDNKRSIILSFLFIIPLIIFGIYKNGVLLYQKHYISFFMVFKPLILVGIGIVINFLLELLINKNKRINYSYLDVVVLTLFLPISTNILIYSVVLLVGLALYKVLAKFTTFNNIAFLKLLIVMALFFLSSYNYMNMGEIEGIYAYNIYDFLWGKGVGGISSTNIILGVVIYILLCNFTNYKKSMFPISFCTYFAVMLIFKLVFGRLGYDILLSSSVILSFILVLPENSSSCYTNKGIIISSILVGVITALLSFLIPMEAPFIAILLISILSKFIDKFVLVFKK